jgi:hypothetical protein
MGTRGAWLFRRGSGPGGSLGVARVRAFVHLSFSSFCRERIVLGIGLSGKLVFQLV